MGIDYSLCLVLKREHSDLLLVALGELLDARSRDRIGAKKWLPESESRRSTLIGTVELDARGIAGLDPTDGESSNSYCLSLHIQLERQLESLVPDHRFNCFDQPGSFGCMWTSIFAGQQYLLLEMTAATSGMSRILQQSAAVHSAWVRLARKTNALFAYIDVEDQTAIQLFPTYGDLRLPDYETLAFADDYRFSVDRIVSFLVTTTSG